MHAVKALLLVVIGGTVVAGGAFAVVPGIRPPVVKKWFRSMAGFTPARTPQEALDRFRDCVKKRDYETAAELYCAGDYREQMLRAAPQARELGLMLDSLADNMDAQGVNNPTTKYTLKLLEPFPKSFKVTDVKERGDRAVATLGPDDDGARPDRALAPDFFYKHGAMVHALLPVVGDAGLAAVELVKDPSGFWKLNLPVTTRLRLSVDYLKDNGTNYRNAIRQVRDEVKNSPTTKDQIQAELQRRLNESR